MTGVDVSKIKVGDVVGVRVLSIAATGAVEVRTEMDCSDWLHPSAIVSHTPAPKPALKVGDRVKSPSENEWEVVFIDEAGYAHFAGQVDWRRAPEPLSEVEQWERV